jgi:21S rRNA (GM2251-2'-O)-methyltransferase
VYGVQPVLLALRAGHRTAHELLVQDGLLDGIDEGEGEGDEAGEEESSAEMARPRTLSSARSKKERRVGVTAEILRLARALGVDVRESSKHDMNMLVDSKPHQGFVLTASKLSFDENLKNLPAASSVEKNRCVLVLDEVWDPQNFGSLLRTGQFFGLDQVIVCAKNSAPLGPSVSKASAGAMEVMAPALHSTTNLMKFLDDSKEQGWQVVGTSSADLRDRYAPEPVSLYKLFDMPQEMIHVEEERAPGLEALGGTETMVLRRGFDHSKPCILVLGNEGYGLRTNILRRCDVLVHIPRLAADPSTDASSCSVDSLNVGVAGGIILQHLLNRPKL